MCSHTTHVLRNDILFDLRHSGERNVILMKIRIYLFRLRSTTVAKDPELSHTTHVLQDDALFENHVFASAAWQSIGK